MRFLYALAFLSNVFTLANRFGMIYSKTDKHAVVF